MLFIVNSNPQFSRPEEVASAKVEFRQWIDELKSKKKVINSYHKIGKGSVVLFDVLSNDELNDLMTKWLSIVPVPITYDIIPLVTPV